MCLKIKSYTNRMEKWHDKRIIKKEFREDELVLFFKSILKLFPVNSDHDGRELSW